MVTVAAGDTIRVFGRSLGFDAASGECISAASTPTNHAWTRLQLSANTASNTNITDNTDNTFDAPTLIASTGATCYEASFPTGTIPPGRYPQASVLTRWGQSSSTIDLTVVPSPQHTRSITRIEVSGPTFRGNLTAAVAAAAAAVATSPSMSAELELGSSSYTLTAALVLPPRTSMVGSGPGQTSVVFDISVAPPAPATCQTPHLIDLWRTNCTENATHGCWQSVASSLSARSVGACCNLCKGNAACNGFTFIANNPPHGTPYCMLKSCTRPNFGCLTAASEPVNKFTPSATETLLENTDGGTPPPPLLLLTRVILMTASFHRPGVHNRTSALMGGRGRLPTQPLAAGVVAVGDGNMLANFSIVIAPGKRVPAGVAAVWMQENSTRFTATGLNITMHQANVSNAFKIEGAGFELEDNIVAQVGECNYPNYGPKSDSTSFQSSVTLYFHNARGGSIRRNTIYWRCSAYDMDVSDRIIFEENQIVCTEHGVVPHGNSVSGYDARTNPSSRWWSFARNKLSRPAYTPGTEQNWIQRETLTTDGSGSFGTAVLLPPLAATLAAGNATGRVPSQTRLRWLVWAAAPTVGTSLVVLRGPGVGQRRRIVGVDSSPGGNGTVTTVELDAPFDNWVVHASDHPGTGLVGSNDAANAPHSSVGGGDASLVAVLASFGSKLFVGNVFNWTEVVQWYGNTYKGVIADNQFKNCNTKPGGNVGANSLGARGECYHGSDPVFFTEFFRNTMENSDGIGLSDGSGPTKEWQCAAYVGPWIRWTVVRSNTIAGISDAARNVSAATGKLPACGAVTLMSNGDYPSTAVVAEQNVFHCPPEAQQNSSGYHFGPCAGCVERV